MHSLIAELPFVGQIKSDKYSCKLIWDACPLCGKQRWVRLGSKGGYCRSCFAKTRTGERNPFYGKHHNSETRLLLSSIANQRPRELYKKTAEHRAKISAALKGKKHSPEHIEKNRLVHLGIRHTEEWKLEHSRQLKGRKNPFTTVHKEHLRKPKSYMPPFSSEHRRKIGEANRRRWNRPGFAERILAKLRSHAKPNKVEGILFDILDRNFPGQWKYVGDGKVIIEKKNPDFINCDGKKLVIELFGDYWHDATDEVTKPQFYLKYGFRCLIIWQHELRDPEKVLEKVRVFSNG